MALRTYGLADILKMETHSRPSILSNSNDIYQLVREYESPESH